MGSRSVIIIRLIRKAETAPAPFMKKGALRHSHPTSAPPTIRERIQMAEDTSCVTLEVAIDSSLYDNLIHAAANRGQSVLSLIHI